MKDEKTKNRLKKEERSNTYLTISILPLNIESLERIDKNWSFQQVMWLSSAVEVYIYPIYFLYAPQQSAELVRYVSLLSYLLTHFLHIITASHVWIYMYNYI